MAEHTAADAPVDPQEFYQRVGEITRTLHTALRELGYDKKIETTLGHLPDARSRLNYIARLTGEAAEKVLNTVDAAQAAQSELGRRAEDLETRLVAGEPLGPEAMLAFVREVRAGTERAGSQLTEIMMAQDFHDLTGQTVHKVVNVAADIEESLLKLLLEASPAGAPVERGALDGPVHDPRRTDVVANQEQVDDLLESLGF